ncbi:hypothetical protein [Flavobacterium sp.]
MDTFCFIRATTYSTSAGALFTMADVLFTLVDALFILSDVLFDCANLFFDSAHAFSDCANALFDSAFAYLVVQELLSKYTITFLYNFTIKYNIATSNTQTKVCHKNKPILKSLIIFIIIYLIKFLNSPNFREASL